MSHFELTVSGDRLPVLIELKIPFGLDVVDKIVHVDDSGNRTVLKDRLRAAVEAHGSPELKSKSDGILRDMDSLNRALGGPPLAEALEQSLCATCGRKVDPSSDFKDELSRREWRIGHMCQGCQDVAFAEPDE